MRVALLLILQSAVPVSASSAPTPFDLGQLQTPSTNSLSPPSRCDANGDGDGADIVVCARNKDRYRLPLPIDRDDPDDRRPGDVATGVSALSPAGPCGIFAGERRCSKAEAARYGYGDGRDPITLAIKVSKKIADPDAD